MKKVFITRDISTQDKFYTELTSFGLQVEGQSFLQFTQIDFEEPMSDYQWIFFYSKKGVDFFMTKSDIPAKIKVGTIGEATARYLDSKYNVQSDYIGKSDPVVTAHEFSDQLAGGDVVLFVRANFSKKSVQCLLQASSVIDLVVYDNQLKKEVPAGTDADIIVLTSPLNAKAFFDNGLARENQKYIAIGMTTGKELEAYIDCYDIAVKPSERGLIDAVLNQ